MTMLTFSLLILFSALGDPIAATSGKIQISGPSGLGKSDFKIADSETSNLFAIYLAAEPVDSRLIALGQGDWSRVRLSESALISADDIISYNFTEHSMRLRAEALARIPRPPAEGTPFIVVAHGERIYLGTFMTSISSIPSAVPSVVVGRPMSLPTQPRDTLVIERAFPSRSFGVGQDPRGDERIKTALKALNKLKSNE